MTLSNFRLNVLLRVLFIGSAISLFIVVVYRTSWTITPTILLAVACLAITSLVRYVERTNQEFSDFLLSIRNADFSKHHEADKRGKSFVTLKQAFNAIIEEFQTARIDKEAHYIFLQTVVGTLNTAIISFDKSGEVKLINDAAKQLLNVPFLDNVNYLEKINPSLYEHLVTGSNEVLELSINNKQLKLLLRCTDFRLQDVDHKLVLITNIKTEIERTEVEAWEQLLHVLTHEIMNSITPISSLSATIKKQVDVIAPGKILDEETLEDMSKGLQVIENRSAGLVNFVNHYKTLLSLPHPDRQNISVHSIFERMRLLTQRQLEEQGILLTVEVKNKMMAVSIDINLIEQVLLNLINNAVDALESIESPTIELSAERQNDKTIIKVMDNGKGIDPEISSKIFIPFFTTKQKGTGIGLSLSRQIMRLHNGSINVNSIPGEGTVFNLEFD